MRNVAIVWKKEFLGYFFSPIAYLFMVVFLICSVLAFLNLPNFFLVNRASMRGFFETLPYLYILLVPALTMRLWSEERKQGTMEILMTLPLREWELLLGKFAAAWTVLLITLGLTIPIPLFVEALGNLDWGPVVGGYFAAAMLGAAYISVGIFMSGLFRNQILSFIGTTVILAIFVAVGHATFLNQLDEVWRPFYQAGMLVGFLPHFESISRGVLDSKDIIYFLCFTFLFLVLNRFSIEVHRYS
ncbi:MAG: ABC transporter permease subunit [Planctomycetota bacterium]|jgi:ABC-2 type transport system permease protein